MNISQEKDRIRDIVRRTSMRNYFSPLLPKYHKARKAQIPRRLENLNINLKNITLKFLISPKNQNLIKEVQKIAYKPRYFTQLSSNTLNFSEPKEENPTSYSLQQSLETESELLSIAPNDSKINNPKIHSIIYENPEKKFQYRHVLNPAKKIKRETLRNYNGSMNSIKYPSPKQLSQEFLEASLDPWEVECFPDFF